MAGISNTKTKCPNCGGLLKYHSFGVLKCSCCNNIFNIETKDPDILNQANRFRLDNCFAEALSLYNEILSKDPNFPEANWGALLSEYGVEYVNDNGTLIPTIHRPIRNYSIIEDKYAVRLLENTYGDEHDEYFSKITELERLREQIEKKSTSSVKYDVFLSCKITKENCESEEKTEEYKWAEKIYKKLVERGLSVFFSPYSLPASNGAYEPIIYSALQSAKYLVVFASNSQHLNSKWIKNEWSRFLEIRKREKEERFYKLIIDLSVSKDVPVELKDVSYIEHDLKNNWITQLEKAVLDVFPNIKDTPYGLLNPNDNTILNFIKKKGNKKLQPNELEYSANQMLIVPKNPYIVHYHELDDDYTIEDNVAVCIRMVELQLRNEHYRDAQYELNKYLNFLNNPTDLDLDFNILVLKMLIESKSKSIEDFFENKLHEFDEFVLFEKIIMKLPSKVANDYLQPIANYIINSIKNNTNRNAVKFYKVIANINSPLIVELNFNVLQCLPYLYGNPNLLMEFAEISIPYVSNVNINEYLNLCTELADGLCGNALWKEAEEIVSNLKKAYGITDETDCAANSKVALLSLMIENKSRLLDDLMEKIEEKQDYYRIEDLIPNLYSTGVNHLISLIKSRINYLIGVSKFDRAAEWARIVAKINFDSRDEYFESLIEKCKTIPQSVEVFDVVIHTLDEDKKDLFISATTQFIQSLLSNNMFLIAKKYCKELIEYDEDNFKILNYYLSSELESSSMSIDNIHKLKDMSIVEKMLLASDTSYARKELLTKLINACIRYVDRNDVDKDDNVFVVFEKLLTYFTEINNTIKNKVHLFADTCLQKGLFERAKWYFIVLIRWDQEYHKAYWGIILANNNCRNNEELVQTRVPIDTLAEYALAIKYARGYVEYENTYTNVLSEQLQYLRKKKSPKKVILIGVVLFLIFIAFVLIQLLV